MVSSEELLEKVYWGGRGYQGEARLAGEEDDAGSRGWCWEMKEILQELNRFFESMVEVKQIRHGEHQTLETLINEEAQIFAYLRCEVKTWSPRVPCG